MGHELDFKIRRPESSQISRTEYSRCNLLGNGVAEIPWIGMSANGRF